MTACSLSTFNPVDRAQQRHSFLTQHGYKECVLLAADCSPRQYYRLKKDGQSFVLMDTPASEHPEQFCRLAQELNAHQLSAPKILLANFEQGFLILEDLGDQTYTRVLTDQNTPFLYTLSVDTLIHLHRSFKTQPFYIEPYTADIFTKEALLFLEWYYPSLSLPPLPEAAQQQFQMLFHQAFTQSLKDQPKGLVLRDYHVDNLMYLSDRTRIQQCGLLDFQCALWGPLGYDFVSLVEDARRDVDLHLKEQLWKHYLAALPDSDPIRFRQASAVFSLGRHLKILGIFARQAILYKRPQYLVHIPRVPRLVNTSLKEAARPELTHWFNEYLPDEN